MGECVLFTAVGGTDPISNEHDGAILHICRAYKPSKVYMFMSYDILKSHRKDNRYVYALTQLKELLDIDMDIEIIEREDLIDVHKFDNFYCEYESILDRVAEENPSANIILNISSGTPAMKSALIVISKLGKRNYTVVQVAHPHRSISMSIEDRAEYLPELQWECNKDNCDDFENRCSEYTGENFTNIIKKEMILKHVESYDYCAALNIANEIKDSLNTRGYNLLKIAVFRLQQNRSEADKILQNMDCKIYPVGGNERLIFEYTLWLQIKYQRKDYSDFIRGITPLIVDAYELYINKICKINLKRDYYKRTTRRIFNDETHEYTTIDVFKYDESKLKATETGRKIKNALDIEFNGFDFSKEVYSKSLLTIIRTFNTDKAFLNAGQIIEQVEHGIRNIAAHEIVSVNYDWIVNISGYTPEKIMNAIRILIEKSCPSIRRDMWDSYVKMNDLIKKSI